MPRVVISIFDRFIPALEASKDLIESGFPRDDVSLVVLKDVMQRSEGNTSVDPKAVWGRPYAARYRGVGHVAGAGPLLTQTDSGTERSLVRELMTSGLPEENAHVYAEGVRQGGAMVAVRVDEAQSDRAVNILTRHNPVDIDEYARRWRSAGWSRFDENAAPLSYDQLNWPQNLTEPDVERHDTVRSEDNWPADITEEPTFTEVREEEAQNWPHSITAREDEIPGDMEEDELLDWPHNITARTDD